MIYASSSKQRQLIGYFRKLLAIDADTYYEIIAAYGVKSSKELNYNLAEELINNLKNKAIALGKYKSGNYDKYKNLSGRKGMATEKQLKKINVMWKTVSRQPTEELKEVALNAFVKRIASVESVNFLPQDSVNKVIKAIKSMQQKKRG